MIDEAKVREILAKIEDALSRGREAILHKSELRPAEQVAKDGLDQAFERDSEVWRRGHKLVERTTWQSEVFGSYADPDDVETILRPWVEFYRSAIQSLPGTAMTKQVISFRAGERVKAVDAVQRILYGAKRSVLLVDNYADEQILQLAAGLAEVVRIEVLTRKAQGGFLPYLKAILDEGRSIETRKTNDNHDRYIVIDDQDVWHVGPSISNIGAKVGTISKVGDDDERARIFESLRESWRNAAKIE